MFQLNSHIILGDFEFHNIVSVTTKSSYESLTDTCKIVIPRKVQWEGKPIIAGDNPPIKRGDSVTVQLGYDGELESVFIGFITDIKSGTPIEITCEDMMYKLKQTVVTKSYAQVNLKQLLSDILPTGTPFQCPDVNLGQFRISKASVAKVLDKLKSDYRIYSWFREGKLYSGLPIFPDLQKTLKFGFQQNITQDDDLQYLRKEDVKLKVKAISMLPNNTKIEVELGDPEGEQRTLHYYNLSKTALEATATREIEKLRYEGFRGKFTALGFPAVLHGDIAELADSNISDRNGKYIIKSVERNFGANGYRQIIELDKKAG